MADKGAVRFRWLRGLTLTLQILFWIVVAFEGLAVALWLAALFMPKTDVPYVSLAVVTGAAGALPYLIAMLVLPVWTAVVAAARPPRKGDGTRLWAWLGFLIPGACYVAPALVFRTLAREAAPQDGPLRVLALAFWSVRLVTTFLGGFLLLILCILVFGSDADREMPVWACLMTICLGAAALLGLRLAVRLSRAMIAHVTSAGHAEVF
ncbi:hypothetical protein [Asticcacaulis solisilvae]|uniref:hypothetical protein n=1 Tax=Asticcacaulis solisilvae TaxID=1217274 RepID=UPI003FD7B9D4